MTNKLGLVILATALSMPAVARAQHAVGIGPDPTTATDGARVIKVAEVLDRDEELRFDEDVRRERRPSYRYEREVRVGTELPESGVRYYDVPSHYRVRPGYRYTIINEQPVLVEGRRIVQVLRRPAPLQAPTTVKVCPPGTHLGPAGLACRPN